jgi:hypothetical protein
MHVGTGFWQKVHYNALFGDGKSWEKISTQSSQSHGEGAEKSKDLARSQSIRRLQIFKPWLLCYSQG